MSEVIQSPQVPPQHPPQCIVILNPFDNSTALSLAKEVQSRFPQETTRIMDYSFLLDISSAVDATLIENRRSWSFDEVDMLILDFMKRIPGSPRYF